jgi:hypothetical protein|tara:strand:- start:273 stop:449 length:177 start_codon:yes stop_codon:yes gene_type:complete
MSNNYKGRRKVYKKNWAPKGPFQVQQGLELNSEKNFLGRLFTLLTNPFLYLFKGKIRY